jgi:hypothetical protein
LSHLAFLPIERGARRSTAAVMPHLSEKCLLDAFYNRNRIAAALES